MTGISAANAEVPAKEMNRLSAVIAKGFMFDPHDVTLIGATLFKIYGMNCQVCV